MLKTQQKQLCSHASVANLMATKNYYAGENIAIV